MPCQARLRDILIFPRFLAIFDALSIVIYLVQMVGGKAVNFPRLRALWVLLVLLHA